MSDQPDGLEQALEQVITAARAHLAAVRAAGGAIDDRDVWQSYVTLNNLSVAYDRLLLEEFGETTPWETELIETSAAAKLYAEAGLRPAATPPPDPYPDLLSVRQRRDYRVPSTARLLAAAAEAASRMALDGQAPPPPETVGDAVLELVRYSDGSLSGLEVPELEPLGGVVVVSDRAAPLDLSAGGPAGGAMLAVGPQERLLGRLDEQPYPEPGDAAEPGGAAEPSTDQPEPSTDQ